MAEEHWWAVRGRPTIAPFGERDDDRCEFASLVGEQVLVELRILRVAGPLHDSRVDQAVESGRQNVRRYAETLVKIAEACGAGEQGVSHDQKSPSLADDLEGTCRRAHLGVIGLAEHPRNLSSGLA